MTLQRRSKEISLNYPLQTLFFGAFLAILFCPSPSYSNTICAGKLDDGTVVTAALDTVGAYLTNSEVRVTVKKNEEIINEYLVEKATLTEEARRFDSINIWDYYSSKSGRNGQVATVGLRVFHEKPGGDGSPRNLEISYRGPNYNDAEKALLNTTRKKKKHNSMQLWKGPGHNNSENYYFDEITCSAPLDP